VRGGNTEQERELSEFQRRATLKAAWNALAQRIGSSITWSFARRMFDRIRRSAASVLDRSSVQNRFQRKLWIEMVRTQPVAIEQR
jgi:hypothetical protein